jgi:Ca-activated chloride channel family protein
VLYESSVIESYKQPNLPFPVVAIYPKEGTFWSDHPVAVVKRPWVTDEHREGAETYIAHLLERPQQEKAVAHGFRPGDPAIAPGAPIDAAHGVDPREPRTTLEVPPADVMAGAIDLWRKHKKHAEIVLVFDTSGSMKEEDRMPHAKAGAVQLLDLLAPEDEVSLLPFSSGFTWAGQRLRVADHRDRLKSTVNGFYPDGGTFLYDSIGEAYQYLVSNPRPDRIRAVVVLTDGDDQTSQRLNLPALRELIKADNERASVRIFTIAYGSGAKTQVLKDIAEATNAKSFTGTPQNIRAVFKEIATFF